MIDEIKIATIGTSKALPDLCEDKATCCGCTACATICTVGAISMFQDEEGFLFPEIDESKCVRCYKCIIKCVFKQRLKERCLV